jgi:hypothetical protein
MEHRFYITGLLILFEMLLTNEGNTDFVYLKHLTKDNIDECQRLSDRYNYL